MKNKLFLLLCFAIGANCISCAEDKPENQLETTETSIEALTSEDEYSGLPDTDYGGMEITIFGYRASQSYNDSEFYEAEQTGEIIDDALFYRNLDTEQRLNIELNYYYPDGETDTLNNFNNSVLAGDDIGDVFAMKAIYTGNLLTSGTVLPWDGIDGYDLTNPWYVHDANEVLNIGGKQYGILSDALGTNTTMCWVWVFNTRLADEWGIGDLYDTVRAGEWTMDEVMSLTRDMWQDLNGNNERDGEDFYGVYTDKWATLDAFMPAHGINSIKKNDDGHPEVDFYSERLVTSFEKVYDLYWNSTGTYVDETEPYVYRVNFANGQAVFSPMLLNYLIGTDLRSMNDDYGLLPYPKLDAEQTEYKTPMLGRCGIFFLPANISNEKAEAIGEVIEVLSAYSYKYLRPAIYDVSLTEKGVRDESSVEMLDLIMDSRSYDFSMFLEQSGNYTLSPMRTYRNQIGEKNSNITSYYEANKDSAIDFLENLLENIPE